MLRYTLYFLSTLFIMSCGTTNKIPGNKNKPIDQRIAASTVDMNDIKSHIYFLASDELKGRDTGSEGLNIAAQYIKSSLVRYGVKPVEAEGIDGYFQSVPMKQVEPANKGELSFGATKMKYGDDFFMINGDNLSLEGDIVFANRASKEDLTKLDVKGKIVVAICGFEGEQNPQQWFFAGRTKRKMVKEMGAKGLIEIYSNAQLPYKFLKGFFNRPQTKIDDEKEADNTPFLHVWMDGANAKNVTTLKAATGEKCKMTVDGLKETALNTHNIVGYLPGSDPKLKDEYIIYSAHYDHVGVGRVIEGDSIYNGTRDNAVGTVTVLSAAQNIAKHPTKRSALFIFFTGEEKGLLGSSYYADNPAIPLDKMTYCFNSDNAGYNDVSKAMIIGLERTHADKFIKQACTAFGLEAIKDNMPKENLFDRSDNVNFAKKGVPAPTFGMGITAMDDEVNKYYHKPQDNPDSVDYDYLVKFFRSYVYACRLIANTKESVFWKEGDKYYEAGVKLYEKKK